MGDITLKILITGFPTLGGSGLVATKLGLQLAKRGHDVHFLFYKEPFFLHGKDIAENITFHLVEQPDYALFKDIGSPYTIHAGSKMIEIVRDFNIDIIHTHYAIPHAVSAYLAKNDTGVKIVNTAHGSDTHTLGLKSAYRPVISLALHHSSAVTSVSDYLARKTEQVFDLPDQSVDVVYNFIELDEFTPYQGEKEKSIIQASNFRPIKQIPKMIEIFAEVAKDFPDWTLKLVGYGPEYPICVRKSRELGIRDQVKFLGVRRDVPQLISQSSILASTSEVESFGLTVAEGMASETAVWAPRTGGIPEICIHDQTGKLYDPDDQVSAVNNLADLMADRSKRIQYGKSGRERIQKHFSPEIIVTQYENIYNRILEE